MKIKTEKEYIKDIIKEVENNLKISEVEPTINDNLLYQAISYSDSLKNIFYANIQSSSIAIDYISARSVINKLIITLISYLIINTYNSETVYNYLLENEDKIKIKDNVSYDSEYLLKTTIEISKSIGDIIINKERYFNLKYLFNLISFNFYIQPINK